ncbi:A24 family peptidase [Sphingomonas bacterium]|uniref:A24 family peptidase n=1 Tax=Sphingomonas bacterium TaxID=1895847 RepID=UPI0015772048|nr:prepilin peptidase [Sphingomonas bacterium]
MGGINPTVALPIALALLLVLVGIEDARTREIANWKNAAIALLAPAWWWATGYLPWPDVAAQLALAVAVFALFCGAFALGQMGGGDVKLIGALALWLPFQPLVWMLMAMSIAGGALTLVMLVEGRWLRRPGRIEVPYGVAIAVAALMTLPRTAS